MVIALLFMVGVTTITGMANLAVERGQGPLAGLVTQTQQSVPTGERLENGRDEDSLLKEVHETAANITLILVVFHFGPASIAHRENLVRMSSCHDSPCRIALGCRLAFPGRFCAQCATRFCAANVGDDVVHRTCNPEC